MFEGAKLDDHSTLDVIKKVPESEMPDVLEFSGYFTHRVCSLMEDTSGYLIRVHSPAGQALILSHLITLRNAISDMIDSLEK